MSEQKKKGSCLKTALIVIAVIFVLLILIGVIFGSGEESDVSSVNEAEETVVDETGSDESGDAVSEDIEESADSEEVSNVFHVGDVVETDNLRITFVSAEQYQEENEFLQPKDGYEYWRFEFNFENISDTDQAVSSMMDWECYADNQKVDQTWLGDESGLDATLSSGRTTQGSVYFEIPVDAESIELEYSISFWNSDKIIFVGK